MIKAVIFDIYGTLLNTELCSLHDSLEFQKAQVAAIKKVAKEHGMFFSAREFREKLMAEIRLQHGKDKDRGIKYPEVRIEELFSSVFQRMKIVGNPKALALEYYNICEGTSLYEGAKSVLAWLRNNNIPAGIHSNAQFYTEIDLKKKLGNIDELFESSLIFYSYIPRISKPEEKFFEMLITGLARFEIKPKQTLFVGNDMRNDIFASYQHGFKTCLTINNKTVMRDIKLDPDYKIKHLKEIIEIVENENFSSS